MSRTGISIKTPEEIDKMRIAGRIAADTLEMITPHVRPGISTEELDRICHEYILAQDSIPAPLHYHGYPKSICTSINHQVCHGIPSKRILKNGDILNLDVTVITNEFHGDTSKMFFIGKPSIQAKRLVETTYAAMRLGVSIIKPGIKLGDIGHIIQQFSENNHYSVVREYCGHGIGREFHEEPQILHFGKPDTGITLCEGMTFTIEPMINAGKRQVKLMPDKWTVITSDHSLSAQWEHTLAVTADGYEILTLRTDEISDWSLDDTIIKL